MKIKLLRNVLINSAVFIISCTVGLYFFDFILTLPYFTNIYGSVSYVERNSEINSRIMKETKDNYCSFRVNFDFPPRKKLDHEKNIIVLGDSFVWGDGVRNVDDIWTRQLAKKIESIEKNIKLFDLGYFGWSTEDEFLFLKEEGIKFSPDLVIFGFVENDPYLRELLTPWYKLKPTLYKNVDMYLPFLNSFPNLKRFLVNQLFEFLIHDVDKFRTYGITAWKDRLYEKNNLLLYEHLLKEIKMYLDDLQIPFFFVTLPHVPDESLSQKYNLIIPIMNKLGIDVLNLYPIVVEKFSGIPRMEWKFKLCANPANGHPGKAMGRVYAEETLDYLNSNYKFLFQPTE